MSIDFARLDRAFNPRCIAVVGDKDKLNWIRAQSSFKGRLYSVQISPRSIEAIESLGVKNFTSLRDVPDPVDLVIVAVPRSASLQILEDCIQKEVAAAQFFTAGFAESGTEEGKRLETALVARAKQVNFYLIGPNCMGIFNPAIGLRQDPNQYTDVVGAVGLISQSGTHARDFILRSRNEGVYLNKAVSFGNGVVLDSADYLEYFGQDPQIKVIGMYLEGVRYGKRFLSILRQVSPRKPVVIWKGGRSAEGARAIQSHTSSLAMPQTVWDAAVKQSGAIGVSNLEELMDTLKALLYLPEVRGKRVGITGGSGGQSVAVADAFAEAGLEVPLLTQESYDKLASFFDLTGASCRNPIDPGGPNRREMKRVLEILEQDPKIDNLVAILWDTPGARWDTFDELDNDIRLLIDMKMTTSKPLMTIIPSYTQQGMNQARDIADRLRTSGIPTFGSFERGARALRNALDYYRHHGER